MNDKAKRNLARALASELLKPTKARTTEEDRKIIAEIDQLVGEDARFRMMGTSKHYRRF